jgi:hypothetical protein
LNRSARAPSGVQWIAHPGSATWTCCPRTGSSKSPRETSGSAGERGSLPDAGAHARALLVQPTPSHIPTPSDTELEVMALCAEFLAGKQYRMHRDVTWLGLPSRTRQRSEPASPSLERDELRSVCSTGALAPTAITKGAPEGVQTPCGDLEKAAYYIAGRQPFGWTYAIGVGAGDLRRRARPGATRLR